MTRPIQWSSLAKSNYLYLLDYLNENWGLSTAKKFHHKMLGVLNNISKQPEMFPASQKRKDVRRCVISKQVSLVYQIKQDRIELITLFDNRQDPQGLENIT